MGADGWFTFFLSNILIVLGLGVGLAWKTFRVIRVAKQSPANIAEKLELILIPCVRLEGGEPNRDFVQRLEKAMTLHRTHNAPLLLLGGQTGAAISEAAAGAAYLSHRGVAAKQLLLEERSRNTLENLHNARQLIHSHGFNKLAIVSNRYHLARCQTLAEGLSLHPQPCAAENQCHTHPRLWPRLLLEAYYLHWYTTGKLWSRLTRNAHSLSRIS